MVNFLVENDANIHARDSDALRRSAEVGHFGVVKFLVNNGADIHAGNDSALGWSARKGHLDVVKFLVEEGANIHTDDYYALRWSTKNGERIGTNVPFSTCPLGTRSYEYCQFFNQQGC